ncbi:hypothetical protein [Leifsonia sp. 1010]|uniref:hypothetical protein n=1 Tax=Leifsonia sp. 1010 TaxID=2817769 RepID=UPI00286AC3E3|nr:hypothetical protein [Leifsonia sp. 1010]
MLAGFAIGIGYQFQPFLHARRRARASRILGASFVCSSALLFVVGLLVVGAGWAPQAGGLGLLLLGLSVAVLLLGLTEFYPEGANQPGLFLIPVGLDGLMLQSFAPLWSTPAQFVIAVALFMPGTIAAVVLTVWAFRVRRADKASYAKATETARGVLWAWALLVAGVLVWTWFGIKFTDTTWMNPVVWGLPLVTVGSVLATATAGWSKYVEARAEIEATRDLPNG